jgi:hypothetical protein
MVADELSFGPVVTLHTHVILDALRLVCGHPRSYQWHVTGSLPLACTRVQVGHRSPYYPYAAQMPRIAFSSLTAVVQSSPVTHVCIPVEAQACGLPRADAP